MRMNTLVTIIKLLQTRGYCLLLFLLITMNSSNVYSLSYYVLLTPNDCSNCTPIFSRIEKEFFNKNGIKFTIITPFQIKEENERIVNRIGFNKENYIKCKGDPIFFRKYNHTGFSSLLVIDKNDSVLYNSELINVNIDSLPIDYKLKLISKQKINDNSITFYANKVSEIDDETILITNLIYSKVFIKNLNGLKELQLNKNLYYILLSKFLKYDSTEIIRQQNSLLVQNVKLITPESYAIYKKDIYLTVSVPIANLEGDNFSDYKNFLLLLNKELTIKSIHLINDHFELEGIRYKCTFIYPINVSDDSIFQFISYPLSSDSNQIIKKDTINPIKFISTFIQKDSVLSFSKFEKSSLPQYYLLNNHNIRNLWPFFVIINNKQFVGYEFLNHLENIFSGKSITFNFLDTSGLILPHLPGGASFKPFEIISVKQVDNKLIGIISFSKNKTRFTLYDYSNQKVCFKSDFRFLIKPAADIYNRELVFFSGNLNGSVTIYKYKLCGVYN